MVKSEEKIIDDSYDGENDSYYPPDETILSTKSLTLHKEEICQFHDQTEATSHRLKKSNSIHTEHQSEIQNNKTHSGYSHSLPRHVRTANWITQHVGRKTAPVQVPRIGYI